MSSPFLALPLLEAAHQVIEQLQKPAVETGNEKSKMGKKNWKICYKMTKNVKGLSNNFRIFYSLTFSFFVLFYLSNICFVYFSQKKKLRCVSTNLGGHHYFRKASLMPAFSDHLT